MKSKRGTSQAETILYLFFAVIFIMVGILSVKAYLINAELNKELHLENLDFGIISNRMIASDNCLSARQTITLNDGENDYNVNFVESGNINKNKIKNSIINTCMKGFDTSKYKLKFYELASDGVRTVIGNENGYGTLECKSPPNRKGEFLIGVEGSTTGLGVFEICIS
tara:strand:- start:1079 stop:1582 length:504 start_codon:yes stop_codon:yes gene_type:complete